MSRLSGSPVLHVPVPDGGSVAIAVFIADSAAPAPARAALMARLAAATVACYTPGR